METAWRCGPQPHRRVPGDEAATSEGCVKAPSRGELWAGKELSPVRARRKTPADEREAAIKFTRYNDLREAAGGGAGPGPGLGPSLCTLAWAGTCVGWGARVRA